MLEGKNGSETGPRTASHSRAGTSVNKGLPSENRSKGGTFRQRSFFLSQSENNTSILWRFWNYFVNLPSHSAKSAKTYLLDSHTITTVEIRANLHIGSVPFTGADFPYLKVVCGEPCDVWRMSAPFLSH